MNEVGANSTWGERGGVPARRKDDIIEDRAEVNCFERNIDKLPSGIASQEELKERFRNLWNTGYRRRRKR